MYIKVDDGETAAAADNDDDDDNNETDYDENYWFNT